jgi:hypothetical protein
MVAMAVFPLLHVPPDGEHVSVTLLEGHKVVGPPIAPGKGFTVVVRVLMQPVVVSLYVVVVVPTVTVVTVPLEDPMLATPVLLLIHVPLGVASVNVMLDPIQTEVGPPISAGNTFTVTLIEVVQPRRVYVISTVPPLVPVTVPVPLAPITVAIVTPPLLHVPLPDVLLSTVCAPTHTAAAPVIAFGIGLTVVTTVAKHPLAVV